MAVRGRAGHATREAAADLCCRAGTRWREDRMVARVTRALKHASFQALWALPMLITIVQGARWRP
jgi:hypothetical protein